MIRVNDADDDDDDNDAINIEFCQMMLERTFNSILFQWRRET